MKNTSIILFCFFFLNAVHSTPLTTMLEKKEVEVGRLHNRALSLYYQRCTELNQCVSTSCETSYLTRKTSVPYCGTEFPNAECSSALGGPPTIQNGADKDYCQGINCPDGKMVDFKEAYVWFPPNSPSTSKLAENLCWMNGMNSIYRDVDTTRANGNEERIWTYMGNQESGIMQMFPGMVGLGPNYRTDQGCKVNEGEYFDPRIRPWYVAAATGPKDVILLLDTSGSMSNVAGSLSSESRLDVMKKAAKAVLRTLTQNDFVAVITYNSDATILNGNPTGQTTQRTLLRATNETIYILSQAIDDLYANGETWFHRGFAKAKGIFDRSIRHNGNTETHQTSGCHRIILFLTDGECTSLSCQNYCQGNMECIISGNQPNSSNIVPPSERLGKDVIIFSYTFGPNQQALNQIPRKISCIRKGIFTNIPSGSDPLSYMTKYYQYLAAGLGPNNTVARWSTPYQDGGGLGEMVSVSRPVYSKSPGNQPGEYHYELIGVVGTDVLMRQLEGHSNYANIIENLILRSAECPRLDLPDCTLQQLRKNQHGTECQADELKEDGSSYPLVGSSQCPNNYTSDYNNQQCSTQKTLKDVLCQELNPSTLLPVNEEMGSYESYLCCPGCFPLDAVIGGSVGGVVFLFLLGIGISRMKKNGKLCWKKRVKAPQQKEMQVHPSSVGPPPPINPAFVQQGPPYYHPQ